MECCTSHSTIEKAFFGDIHHVETFSQSLPQLSKSTVIEAVKMGVKMRVKMIC